MPSIEINTTQNVHIQYELATLTDRLIAFIVDAVIMWGAIAIISGIFVAAFGYDNMQYVYFIIIYPIFIFYTLTSEILLDGQTIGKKATGIKIVRIDGNEPTLSDHMVRWSFRMIDIYFSLGSIAVMLVNSTEHHQRLGDIMANTVAIRLKPKVNIQLNDVLHIHSTNDYQPKYPAVKQWKEEDILLIKTTLEQIKKYPNEAHQQALHQLVKKLSSRLQLSTLPKDKTLFLKTLINDYVVLTR